MSELEDITDISGFGPSKIDSFREAGYDSLEDLRGITWDELGEVSGIRSSAKRRAILNFLEERGLKEKPETQDKYEKFRSLLEELFQFETADLDFGVYRIMNEKRDRIEEFLDRELQQKVRSELKEFQATEQGEAQDRLEAAKEQIKEDFPHWIDEHGNIDYEVLPDDAQGIAKERKDEYLEAKSEAEKAEIGESTEAAIYQDLYRFFKRYYEDGDFIPQRRAANQEKYAIPYNGEEIKLHWANKDQYFVKTGEQFKDYKFRIEGTSYEIEFKLHDAHVKKNNKKGDEKFFVLREENPVEQDERFLTVHFEYRPLTEEDYEKYDLSENSQSSTYKKEIRKQTEEKILSEISNELEETLDQEVENPRSDSTTLQKHLKNYRTKNENDYFIHKNLGGFLEQELDFYLKNEVFSWKEMTDDNGEIPAHARARLNAIENIAKEIINFVAEIEDYQKDLHNKKKFVYDTNYLISLEYISEKFYSEILGNEKQILQWKEVYGIKDWDQELNWTGEFTEKFLADNQNLMIDTALFSKSFREKLLSSISGLEQKIGGTAIKGENYQALNLLENKYQNSLDYVYIDPPYNTNSTPIIYKNNYKHSSWMTLINDRLNSTKPLLKEDGLLAVTIDDLELDNLLKLMNQSFTDYEIDPVIIEHNYRGRAKRNFSTTHEYALWAIPQGEDLITKKKERSDDIQRNLRRTGTDSMREDSPNLFYGIEVDNETLEIVDATEPLGVEEGIPEHNNSDTIMVWPIDDEGAQRRWYYGRERVLEEAGDTVYAKEINGDVEIHYFQKGKRKNRKSVWHGKELDSSTYGTELLNKMFGPRVFDFPKSLYAVKKSVESATFDEEAIIMDYFAGSGTTGHAVMEMNKQDDGDRKFILVEMGDHFDNVLLPRLQKVGYAEEWKDGLPQDKNGRAEIIKYQKIEDYEDTLNNLDVGDEQTGVGEFTSNTLEYFLNFEVDGESLLDLDGLKDPFNYQMKIREGDEAKRKTIDLFETFNYLLGLEVEKIQRHKKLDREYRVVKGTKNEKEIIVIWRPVTDDPNDGFYEDEREFLRSNVLGDEDIVYINYDSALSDAKSIEKPFQNRMWE
jgi:adenine-specific DNA-methyltransferase